ncbi:bifunctional hydroxylase/dehydrase [Amycolatopsis lurida]|uniref:Monooxygenase n=1 Tax=Amycolatopsis lurida NRRL 2430 TaxID=1460371 RepID=A0A2P2FW17_AMYLU|nr:FAD-dependent monooxygenase [Amycolatopsis lurida]KFU80928.1 monooxygenase [Amycolatopsis lurida NRRL 2430]SED90216.1 bifunctional hydroxylase/dehydrase [Amycolatopsis lurida]
MDADVIVVGAGPAGLMLAGELRLAGVPVVLIERLERPTGESRGLGFTARTMEILDQRGLLAEYGEIVTSPHGHFGGLPVDFSVLDGIHFSANGVSQAKTEEILAKWATGLGADIRRGWELTGLSDDGTAVTAEVDTPDGLRRLRARYLIGCDGGRSTVRKLAGFEFPGSEPTLEMFLADVAGCALRPRPIGERVPGGMAMSAPIGGGVDRVIVCERGDPPVERDGPPPFGEIAEAWSRLTGEDIGGGDPLWTSSFTDSARQATTYRRGRVLLAGDAAHIHLPAGGQGLNVGLQDALNLGWKLGAVVRGRAPESLLDTYHGERHPVGERLLMNTQAQGLLFLSGKEVEPLREVMGELMAIDEVNRHLVGMISGLEIRYDLGPGEHPLLGRRLPPRELVVADEKTSTTELLREGRGILLDVGAGAGAGAWAQAGPWADRVDVVTASLTEDDTGDVLRQAGAVLVRPDGYVGWVAAAPGESLTTALTRWFGPA